jgi:hypothetical protein
MSAVFVVILCVIFVVENGAVLWLKLWALDVLGNDVVVVVVVSPSKLFRSYIASITVGPELDLTRDPQDEAIAFERRRCRKISPPSLLSNVASSSSPSSSSSSSASRGRTRLSSTSSCRVESGTTTTNRLVATSLF